MSNFTFSISVEEELSGNDPMTEQDIIDYIIFRLEAQSVLMVTNIVRDY
jgi:ABC-type transport system involved in cytochrome bd biosynthesis fused ATPase/permease subunit